MTMKKLLSTTAILGALAISASANAADLQVNVGGFLDFQAGYTADKVIGKGADQRNKTNFNNDTEVHFNVEGKADNGLEYGAVIELEADVNAGDTRNGGTNADKTFLFAQGGFGRVELGANTGAEQALSVNTANFASATGGVDGDFYRYTVQPTNNAAIVRPELVIANSGNGTNVNEDATKITYYTPRLAGLQAGVSYTPNTDAVGVTTPAAGAGKFKDIFAGGLNYSGEFSKVGVKASVAGITGTKNEKLNTKGSLEGYNAGANVSFAGFTVGGSYGDWLESLGKNTDATYWDLGAGYAAGPYSASVTYLNSHVDPAGAGTGNQDKFSNLVVGADYKLAPGFVPYVEASFFDYNGNGSGTPNDNKGTVVLAGTELTF